VQLLDVAFVELDLGQGGGHFRVGEHADLLALVEEDLDFLELLEFGYGHSITCAKSKRGPLGTDPARFKQTLKSICMELVKSSSRIRNWHRLAGQSDVTYPETARPLRADRIFTPCPR